MQKVVEPQKRTIVTAKNVLITLYVDTESIENDDIDSCCHFGQDKHICSNKDFTVNASVGDIIIWQGVSSHPEEDEVNIISVLHEKGDNIFNQNRLPGNSKKHGKVSGLVLNFTSHQMDYEYKISFEVKHNGKKRNGIFHIDPKIRVI